VLASIGVLVIGWQAGSAGGITPSTATNAGNAAGSTDTTGQASGQTTSSNSSSSSSVADGTYTGDDVNTRFGSVQVQITVSGGQITDVAALQLTDTDRRSIQISNRAAPVLRSEVLQSQSANVSNVSGATYTSDAYLQSLQSAIDQAGL
jgi:uncharacterized protein with FMN-binding domain